MLFSAGGAPSDSCSRFDPLPFLDLFDCFDRLDRFDRSDCLDDRLSRLVIEFLRDSFPMALDSSLDFLFVFDVKASVKDDMNPGSVGSEFSVEVPFVPLCCKTCTTLEPIVVDSRLDKDLETGPVPVSFSLVLIPTPRFDGAAALDDDFSCRLVTFLG